MKANKQKDNQKGYDYFVDENTGQFKALHRATGEVTDAIMRPVPIGSITYTPEQQDEYRKRKEQERKKRKQDENRRYRTLINGELGHFFFARVNEGFTTLSAESVARLIYLNTFMRYGDNVLMLTERTKMRHSDLRNVLRLSAPTVSRFWQEVSPCYITETADGLIVSNSDVFVRGTWSEHREAFLKCYINGVRKLYSTAPIRNHKQLGYLFKLLPYINTEYNVLCYNPWETNIEKINMFTISDFCNILKIDAGHIKRILEIYADIVFDVEGHMERFLSITFDGVNRNRARMFVNPHILYSGSDYKKVELLGAFCKE